MAAARQSIERSSLARAEFEVLTRLDAGQSPRQIIAETGFTPTRVSTAISLTSEAESRRMEKNVRQGSTALREALFNEAAAREQRFKDARALSGTRSVTAVSRFAALTPKSLAAHFEIDKAVDRYPAPTREPCARCGTRGELGCAHFAPFEEIQKS